MLHWIVYWWLHPQIDGSLIRGWLRYNILGYVHSVRYESVTSKAKAMSLQESLVAVLVLSFSVGRVFRVEFIESFLFMFLGCQWTSLAVFGEFSTERWLDHNSVGGLEMIASSLFSKNDTNL